MLLCWGEGHVSSVHDHADSHCFMKVLQLASVGLYYPRSVQIKLSSHISTHQGESNGAIGRPAIFIPIASPRVAWLRQVGFLEFFFGFFWIFRDFFGIFLGFFWDFWDFFGIFWDFLGFFWIFLDFFGIFLGFFWIFFGFFWDFFGIFGIFGIVRILGFLGSLFWDRLGLPLCSSDY